jgi:plastocyanin
LVLATQKLDGITGRDTRYLEDMKTLLMIGLVGLAVALPANAVTPKATLAGTVGPGTTITLKKGGTKVTTLKAGLYKFVIADKSASHNFHLKGPAGYTKVLTTVRFVGTKTYLITLKPGLWTYVCDPHSTFMKGSFRVTR